VGGLPRLLVAATMLVGAPALGQQPVAAAEVFEKWGASIDLEGRLGTERHLGEADLFLPLAQDGRNLLFANLRIRLDDNDSIEGNFGLGLRHMHASGWNGGIYGYFDRRRTANDHVFNQITVGVEALGKDVDFRVNSYWPIGRKVKFVDGLNTADLSGTSVVFRGGEEHALRGFDAEVGWRVPVFAPDGPLDLRLYAGGYTFDDDVVDDVTGPRLRAELTGYEVPGLWAGARITLGAEWQHDEPRGGQGFVSARLRIPLQPERERSRRLTAQERRMTAPVQRDVDIVAQAGTFGAPETATQTAGGQAITVLNSATTTGAAVPGAVAAAGANSTVILSGTFNTTAATTLQTGQTLMGAGTLTVCAPSGRTATLTTQGGTLAGTVAGGWTVRLANDSTLTGLTISNNGAYGVFGNGVTGATVSDNTISASETGTNKSYGLYVGGLSAVSVVNNSLGAVAAPAGKSQALHLGVGAGTSTYTVAGNTLSATGGSTNHHTDLTVAVGPWALTINGGSTGNTIVAGTCTAGGGTLTGAIGYTDGSTCP